ncbi:MAG: hypothetical protein EAZ74_03560 [Alphaproteobacteria bacterium]|nr:MAG: hypothetical protein EAY65_00800 [Alphaproteobacteria bacterium]TAE83254.1 MAG: hypothetical protein EAY76_01665 [Alphaproteobacteria bacterium]TAF14622.1 MAG: hypothetical protein EAZ74_03560 [Alphaproteobacteria bacterium]TAF41709.1 MAG: hypothetical protein EAZ66_00835 [Alphaproteobacteria bacterium]TAF75650.1 MAG: hypothetical protein EAZ52_06220 [Alphaproteobacteria bacterium]
MITELKSYPIGSTHEVLIGDKCFPVRLQTYSVTKYETFVHLLGDEVAISLSTKPRHPNVADGYVTIIGTNSVHSFDLCGYFDEESKIYRFYTEDETPVRLKKSFLQRIHNFVKNLF